MNEAELELKVAELLRGIFPTFQNVSITCQHSFQIKFGNHNVLIDGKMPGSRSKQGIYDLLVAIDKKQLILFELKRPDHVISEEDVRQGISYARLVDPICPLTVISNGNDTRVYETLTKNQLKDGDLQNDIITRISQAMATAATDASDSFKLLLEKDYRIFGDILSKLTAQAENDATGEIGEWHKPISKNFNVLRSMHSNFNKLLEKKKNVLLQGDAFIGKTNFLFQFISSQQSAGHQVLYINAKEHTYGMLNRLSNYLSITLNQQITPQDVKYWLLSFRDENTPSTTFIYDHLQPDCLDEVKSEIAELSEIFSGSRHQLILAVDTANVEAICKERGRTQLSSIGRLFTQYKLKGFDQEEFKNAEQIFLEEFNIEFMPGAEYAPEYRIPRIWRQIYADINCDRPSLEHRVMIMPIPMIEYLDGFRKSLQLDRELKRDFVKLCEAYISSLPQLINDKHLGLVAVNIGCIYENEVTKTLDSSTIARLVLNGFLERRPYGELDYFYVPKLPELLAGFAPEYLLNKYLPLFIRDFDSAYREFMSICEFMMYGELVAGKTIMELSTQNEVVFSQVMNRLMNDLPFKEVSLSKKTIAFYPDEIPIQLNFEEGVETVMLQNVFPSLVLAHLTAQPFGDVNSPNPHEIRFKMLARIADNEFMIRRPDRGFIHDGITTIELPGMGEFTHSTKMVEPIVQSLWWNLIHYPKDFKELANAAIVNKHYRLFHRQFIAARFAKPWQNDEIREVINFVNVNYDRLVPTILATAVARNKGRNERRRLERKIKKMRRK